MNHTNHSIGKPHPVQELIQEMRKIFLDMKFDEIENKVFVPEEDVYKQYGSEAPVILDRCYYLAGLPRPDIGLGKTEVKTIREFIKSDIDLDEFKRILREYRAGSIEGDDLSEQMVNRLNISTANAIGIMDVIADFQSVTPQLTKNKITLRSHMTAAWFPTLQAMQHTHELPLRLFSIGLRFRREQKLSPTHLKAHYGASCVIMDEKFNLSDGKKISKELLKRLGFEDITFEKKKATSNYYRIGSEYEIFSRGVEIADCGMYSSIALSKYGILHDVFNLGIGIERVLMVRHGYKDVRELMYPQFYGTVKLSDEEISRQIKIDKTPGSSEGLQLAQNIKKIANSYADKPSPCKFMVYEGKLGGKDIEVYVLEEEENKKLLGPAALNEIYVWGGSIYGIPPSPGRLNAELINIKNNGTKVKFSYLDAISNYFAYEIENRVNEFGESDYPKKSSIDWQVKIARNPSDINIKIGDIARRYITSRNRMISIRGPIFMSVELLFR